MKTFLNAALMLTVVSATARAQINAGELKPETNLPFTMTQVATFKLPWRMVFLPDGRMLVTEKVGPVWLVTQKGEKTQIENAPPVLWQGQGGMLGVYLSPKYATDHFVYITYAEPGTEPGMSGLALARAKLTLGAGKASFDGLQVLWRDMPKGRGGQFGAAIAFSPDGQYLFLTVGDRQRMTPAQDPNTQVGKILRLTLDGKPAPGNPQAGKTGAASLPLINPPRDTEAAKTAPVISTYSLTAPNLAPSETWTSGHRTPYGLAFAPDGRLWEVEHGPRGGDELNLIEPGKNYGWPLVSYAVNYNGVPIPSPDTRSDLAKPVIYWTPIIAPGNLMFYNGTMFPQWKGSALMGGMQTQTLNRITFDGKGGAQPAERWAVGHRIRDVEAGPDGALWMLEDANPGGLYRVTPK
jgi:glucose/arabinose dehydrogenase